MLKKTSKILLMSVALAFAFLAAVTYSSPAVQSSSQLATAPTSSQPGGV
ncbi:hypothetical protein [Lihuaxuella thermophila]|uniref:Uncharacterized protein n=1 Tax=Lihuaxuella thermophila TaxID=1173111 RepID=A0A1H8ISB8_9BACL|nr:hypothetical protein [Lihuaxuella thermophila]SEN71790.1 hypothetical protein SAMN05444955_11950 [Lihuaxuella thermophila]